MNREYEQIHHPCFELKDAMKRAGMNQKELAIRTGVTEKHISTVLNGGRDISVAFARKLGYVFEQDSSYWIKCQAEYDSYQLQLAEQNDISDEELSILKPLNEISAYMIQRGHLQNHCGNATKVMRLRSLLCVSNLTAIPNISYNAAYKVQLKGNATVDPYVLFAWQRLCELETRHYLPTRALDLKVLQSSISEIKHQMFNEMKDGITSLQGIFSKCGIAFQVVRNFRGAPVQGFIKQADTGSVILCLTLRGTRADVFWFTLFHEIGHLLNGDVTQRFVDFDSVPGRIEDAADAFAREQLLDSKSYRDFVRHNFSSFTWQSIETFAEQQNVIPDIIIGRLQKDHLLEWHDFANKITHYRWANL